MLGSAVHNNAVWCDAVVRAHGGPTLWADGLWRTEAPAPPYYSNAVTIAADQGDAQRRRLRAMLESPLTRPWSVKDGFHVLDLEDLGFRILFEATWIGMPAGVPVPVGADGVSWSAVTSASELAGWEVAWSASNPDGAQRAPPVFGEGLLADPDIRFLAGWRGGGIVATAVANRSDDGTGPVVGISNIVLTGAEPEGMRAGAVAAVRAAFPGLPLVGYEQGDDLDAMLRLGFQPVGPLRVWLSPD